MFFYEELNIGSSILNKLAAFWLGIYGAWSGEGVKYSLSIIDVDIFD